MKVQVVLCYVLKKRLAQFVEDAGGVGVPSGAEPAYEGSRVVMGHLLGDEATLVDLHAGLLKPGLVFGGCMEVIGRVAKGSDGAPAGGARHLRERSDDVGDVA